LPGELYQSSRDLRKARLERIYKMRNMVNIGVVPDTADIKIADENKKLTLILYFIDPCICSDWILMKRELPMLMILDFFFNSMGFSLVFQNQFIKR
jgi:hypothetical protein